MTQDEPWEDDDDDEEENARVHLGDTTDLISRASFHLLSIVLADSKLRDLYKQYDLAHIDYWYEELKETETVRLLIEIATLYRLKEWGTPQDVRHKDYQPQWVGMLFDQNNEAYEAQLNALEACHKIIHAREMYFGTEPDGQFVRLALGDTLVTCGKKGKMEWEAHIDLVLFCNAVNQPLDLPF